MTTPNGTPTGGAPARPRSGNAADAAVQANANGSEAKVLGSDQDRSPTGAADASSGTTNLKRGFVDAPSETKSVTRQS